MHQADVLPRTQQRSPGRPAEACIMVIFGAAGDLTRRKLIPALYNLAKAQLLSREFAILGVAHSPMPTEDFRNKLSLDIRRYAGGNIASAIWERLTAHLDPVPAHVSKSNVVARLS